MHQFWNLSTQKWINFEKYHLIDYFKIVFPSNPLGMENRLIADNQIIATDSFSHYKACYARLNGDVCWIANTKVSLKWELGIGIVQSTCYSESEPNQK